MTATLTSDDLDNDRCPKCGLRINDTTLVAIPRAQHEALMVFHMAAAAALPEEIAGLIERLHDPYHSRDEAYKAAAVLRALVQENERLRLAVTNKNEACQELADRIRALEAERNAIRTKTFEDCLAIIPGGTHCDPQEIADAIRALAQTDTVASQPISPSLGATALSESKD